LKVWSRDGTYIFSRDGSRFKSDNLRRGFRLQDRGAVQGKGTVRADSMSSLIVAAGERRGSLGGFIQEHEAFLGHEMRGPARTKRGGIY